VSAQWFADRLASLGIPYATAISHVHAPVMRIVNLTHDKAVGGLGMLAESRRDWFVLGATLAVAAFGLIIFIVFGRF
jgi:hypothetical protein